MKTPNLWICWWVCESRTGTHSVLRLQVYSDLPAFRGHRTLPDSIPFVYFFPLSQNLKNIYFYLIALKGKGRRLCQSLSHVRLFRDPMSSSLLGSSVHGVSQARILEWLPFPPPGYLPDPGIEPASAVLAGRFFTTEPLGKPTDNYILVINYGHIFSSKEI